eukprot:scaffold45525_cov19-Tisochrysis_lutea.AAC.2
MQVSCQRSPVPIRSPLAVQHHKCLLLGYPKKATQGETQQHEGAEENKSAKLDHIVWDSTSTPAHANNECTACATRCKNNTPFGAALRQSAIQIMQGLMECAEWGLQYWQRVQCAKDYFSSTPAAALLSDGTYRFSRSCVVQGIASALSGISGCAAGMRYARYGHIAMWAFLGLGILPMENNTISMVATYSESLVLFVLFSPVLEQCSCSSVEPSELVKAVNRKSQQQSLSATP